LLYLFEPNKNPIVGMSILSRTKGGANFELIEVPYREITRDILNKI